ncbi:MAG TPA: sensor histidine kinase [Candidatus Limnocylindria bacterium]|nr:sensor histidine kinase [Candidatus Limnocylindria bacterium]
MATTAPLDSLPAACLSCENAPAVRRVISSRLVAGRILRAQEEERSRIARELHDDTGQALTLMLVRLRILEALAPEPTIGREIGELRSLVSDSLESVRRLATDLGPTVLRDLGLDAALASLVGRVRDDTGLDIALRTSVEGVVLPEPVALALYRVAQEALTNVVRHADASQVEMRLDRLGGGVRLVVEDDGVGFAVPEELNGSTVGLLGMRERIELVGGVFELASRPGRGTRVAAVVQA